MRILQTSHGIHPLRNAGVEVYTDALSRRLATVGHDVVVAVPDEPGLKQIAGTPYRLVGVPTGRLDWRTGDLSRADQKRAWREFERIVQDVRPEIIHVQDFSHLGWEALGRLIEMDVPFIVSLAGYWHLCPKVQRLCDGHIGRCVTGCLGQSFAHPVSYGRTRIRLRARLRSNVELLNRSPSPLIALSERTAEIYRESGIHPNRMLVDYWGIDRSAATRQPRRSADPVRVVFIGTVYPPKGVDVLIRAYNKLDGDITLDIHGGGDIHYVKKLQRMAGGSRARFHGAYDHRSVGKILSRADVVVVPSVWEETYGLVVQEAWQAGAIVVAADIGGLSERIVHGLNGFLFPSGDADALARQLRHVAKNIDQLAGTLRPDLRARTMDGDAAWWVQFYEWVAGRWADLRAGTIKTADFGLITHAGQLARFLERDQKTVLAKLLRERSEPGVAVRDAWNAAKPETDEQITDFYRTTDSYLYDLTIAHQLPERRRWRQVALALLVKYGARSVLDYGGGCGDDSLGFAEAGFDVTLFDVSRMNLGYARQRIAEAGVKVRVDEVLQANGQYDAVYCTELLEHVPDPAAELYRMASALREGGWLIVTHSFELLNEQLPSHLVRHRGLSGQFKEMASNVGLEFEEVVEVPGNRFYVFRLCRRPEKRLTAAHDSLEIESETRK